MATNWWVLSAGRILCGRWRFSGIARFVASLFEVSRLLRSVPNVGPMLLMSTLCRLRACKREEQVKKMATESKHRQAASRNGSKIEENADTLRHYYYQMLLLRHFEERTGEMYTKARIGGYCHLNLGEEATIVGLMAALRPEDYIFTNYREHGYILARGASPGQVMAELFGRETGVSKGRGGSMHL